MKAREIFDKFALRYDRWYEKVFGKSVYSLELEAIRSVLPPFHMALEVGVGTGRFASSLGIRFGLDVSFSELIIARKRGIQVVLGDAHEMPFPDSTFDLELIVVSICFFEHPDVVLREVARTLSPGGHVILGLVLRESPWAEFYMEKGRRGHPFYSIARFYSLSRIKEMLSSAEFTMDAVVSTLLEPPFEDRPVRDRRIVKEYIPGAGFTVVRALRP